MKASHAFFLLLPLTLVCSAQTISVNSGICPLPQNRFTHYNTNAKKAMWSLYDNGGKDVYCGLEFRPGEKYTAKDKLALNIEHVVPQKYLRNAKAAGGDPHNLWPSVLMANSVRGHAPLVEDIPGESYYFSGESKTELATCDFEVQKNDGNTVVEPSPLARGKLARSILHIALAYPAIKFSMNDLKTYAIWSEKYPVTEEEKVRNNKIATLTGVRNPFIDFPMASNEILKACINN